MCPDCGPASAATPAPAGVRAGKSASWNVWYVRLRRPAQIATLLAFIVLPWANACGWTRMYGSLFAMNIYGLPLADPLSALQVLLTDGYFAVQLWTGAALVLLLAFALGRVFCAWLCPYGLLSELVYALRRRLPPLLPENAAGRFAFWSRIAVCALGIVAALVCGLPVLQRFSMPGELSLAPLRVVEGWAVFLAALLPPGAVLLAEGISGRRLWCRYICPQSVCLAFAAQRLPGGFGVKWDPARCACSHEDRACQRICSLGLTPNRKGGPPRNECSQCAQCVSACAERGAALRIGL